MRPPNLFWFWFMVVIGVVIFNLAHQMQTAIPKQGSLDTNTWRIVGVDPKGLGINSQINLLKRHWLHVMFFDPEGVRRELYPP